MPKRIEILMKKKSCPYCSRTIQLSEMKSRFKCEGCGNAIASDIIAVIIVTLVVVEILWFALSSLLPEMHIAYTTLIHLLFSFLVGVPTVYVSVTVSKV